MYFEIEDDTEGKWSKLDNSILRNLFKKARVAPSTFIDSSDISSIELCFCRVYDLLVEIDSKLEDEYFSIIAGEIETMFTVHLAFSYLGLTYILLLMPSKIDPVSVKIFSKSCLCDVVSSEGYCITFYVALLG